MRHLSSEDARLELGMNALWNKSKAKASGFYAGAKSEGTLAEHRCKTTWQTESSNLKMTVVSGTITRLFFARNADAVRNR